jgi:hypothetical protein
MRGLGALGELGAGNIHRTRVEPSRAHRTAAETSDQASQNSWRHVPAGWSDGHFDTVTGRQPD